MLDFLYEISPEERKVFGDHWCGPVLRYEHFKPVLIARYPSEDGESDGQPVEVWGEAAPARFYQIRVLAGTNSVGDSIKPFELHTGSSMAQLAADIAEAISGGMLGLP